jgi:hypothetical protein
MLEPPKIQTAEHAQAVSTNYDKTERALASAAISHRMGPCRDPKNRVTGSSARIAAKAHLKEGAQRWKHDRCDDAKDAMHISFCQG